MNVNTPVRAISIGGILTAFALLFQSAPVWLGGVGLFLSPLATLPAALAAALSIPLGAVVYMASAFLLLLISPQEAAIFLLATGLLGLTLGVGHKKETPHRILISATALFVGLLALTHLAMIPVFGGVTPGSVWVQILVFPLFCLMYSALWLAAVRYSLIFLDQTLLSQDHG